jgi:hypothetical protein
MGDGVCRALYSQTISQLFLFGGSHSSVGSSKDPGSLGSVMPLSHYSATRGLVQAKSGRIANRTMFVRFDARGDCFLLTNDNADRGTWTLAAFGRHFVPELEWRSYPDSFHHSLLHIDGLGQARKAPCSRMIKSTDDGDVVIGAADLASAYRNEWYPAWPSTSPAVWSAYETSGWQKETSSPEIFGWSASSVYNQDVGLPTSLFGDFYGFAGLFTFKKPRVAINYYVRSTALVRSQGSESDSYFIICDKVSVGDLKPHKFMFHVVLADDLQVIPDLSSPNKVVLSDGSGLQLDVIVASSMNASVENPIRWSVESFASAVNNSRPSRSLVITVQSLAGDEEIWVICHPHHSPGTALFSGSVLQTSFISGTLHVDVGGTSQYFSLDDDRILQRVGSPQKEPSPPPAVSPKIQNESALFGSARRFSAAPTKAGIHPRVMYTVSEWDDLVASYASQRSIAGWHKHFMDFTRNFGPLQGELAVLNALNIDDSDTAVLATRFESWGTTMQGENARMSEAASSALFMTTLHAFVETNMTGQDSPLFRHVYSLMNKHCAIVAAHADLYDCYEPTSPVYGQCTNAIPGGATYSAVWSKSWTLEIEGRTGVAGLAMSYDVLYNRMETSLRTRVRNTIARILRGRVIWGMNLDNERLMANWIPYHSNAFLANLAIEGEGHDAYMHAQYPRIFREYMRRAIYPDGGTLEDGYVTLGFRQGSNTLVALARRGQNYLDTVKFRNFVLQLVHSTEPWACGSYIGGSSGDGGGTVYPSLYALIKYTYPTGVLTKMMWRQR